MAVVLAMKKWRPYLLGRHYIIKTDYFSLKYLLEQKFTTVFHSKWLPKLMVYEYEMQYRQGKENVAIDGLSRLYGVQLMALAICAIQFRFIGHHKRLLDARFLDIAAHAISLCGL